MHTSQVLLQQAVDALQEVDDARKEAFKPYQEAVLETQHQTLLKSVLKANLELDRLLSVAIPISALYAGQYPNQAHRQRRVISLLDSCCRHSYIFIETAVALDKVRGVRNPTAVAKSFLKAVKAVELAHHGLKTLSTTKTLSEKASSNDPLHVAEDYLRQRYHYEDRREALCLREHLTYSEMSAITLEKLKFPFQRFLMTAKALYPALDASKKYDHVNAVWHYLIAASLINSTRHGTTYEKISSTMLGAQTRPTDKTACRGLEDGRHPVAISWSLRTIDIALGFIFSDDPSVIVWPFGKLTSEGNRNVIIYCLATSATNFRYAGVLFSERSPSIAQPSPPLHSSSDIRNMWWRDHSSGKALGPFAPSFLPLLLSTANQDVPVSEPFQFLRLPPELRNRVYVAYLSSHAHFSFQNTKSNSSLSYVNIPDLCKTNRQLLHEVLPLYLDLKVNPLELHERLFSRFSPLGLQPLLRPLLRFKSIKISTGVGTNRYHIFIGISGTESEVSISYALPLSDDQPEVLLRPKQFETLVKILVEDATTKDLGFEELAALYDFLWGERSRKLEIMKQTGLAGPVWGVELNEEG